MQPVSLLIKCDCWKYPVNRCLFWALWPILKPTIHSTIPESPLDLMVEEAVPFQTRITLSGHPVIRPFGNAMEIRRIEVHSNPNKNLLGFERPSVGYTWPTGNRIATGA
jgi:hypothetical protein